MKGKNVVEFPGERGTPRCAICNAHLFGQENERICLACKDRGEKLVDRPSYDLATLAEYAREGGPSPTGDVLERLCGEVLELEQRNDRQAELLTGEMVYHKRLQKRIAELEAELADLRPKAEAGKAPICPLISAHCLRSDCAWYLDALDVCALRALADRQLSGSQGGA